MKEEEEEEEEEVKQEEDSASIGQMKVEDVASVQVEFSLNTSDVLTSPSEVGGSNVTHICVCVCVCVKDPLSGKDYK